MYSESVKHFMKVQRLLKIFRDIQLKILLNFLTKKKELLQRGETSPKMSFHFASWVNSAYFLLRMFVKPVAQNTFLVLLLVFLNQAPKCFFPLNIFYSDQLCPVLAWANSVGIETQTVRTGAFWVVKFFVWGSGWWMIAYKVFPVYLQDVAWGKGWGIAWV